MVAAGDVPRLAIGNQPVERPSGGVGHAVRRPSVLGGGDVRPAHAGPVLAPEGVGQVVQPVGVGAGVVVCVGHDLAGGRGGAGVARVAQAAVLGADDAVAMLVGEPIGRAHV